MRVLRILTTEFHGVATEVTLLFIPSTIFC